MEFAIVLGGGQVGQVISKGIDNIVEQAQLAESLGFTAVFVPDHYVFEEMGDFKKGQPAYEIFFLMTMLAQTTGLSHANTSKHLSVLRQVGLVSYTRMGNSKCFSLTSTVVTEICTRVSIGRKSD